MNFGQLEDFFEEFSDEELESVLDIVATDFNDEREECHNRADKISLLTLVEDGKIKDAMKKVKQF